INAAGCIYNHCIALHKRYYRMWGKHLSANKLKGHIARIRKHKPFWQLVGSQAVQDIAERIDRTYKVFFEHHGQGVRPPNFKKVKRYKSFTLKQAGYKFLNGGRVKIGSRVYQYWNSREIEGKVKTVTVKRTPLGELFMTVVVDQESELVSSAETGKAAGADFGLKTFLTLSDGTQIRSPEFLKAALKDVRQASRSLSRKRKGSANRERARLHLARCHEAVANRRRDWFWKLAHALTNRYDALYFETLNLKGMAQLWGRKVHDLALAEFLQLLQWVAKKKGKLVAFIDQWFPSSKTCSSCGHVLKRLDLKQREWDCPSCSAHHDRDHNASMNIERVGASTHGLGGVRRAQPATAV
ncbi:MAG: RNA-guided endonuclease TnpB family protein, partial [Cyanobacteria bacterium P01_A01_bin.135]